VTAPDAAPVGFDEARRLLSPALAAGPALIAVSGGPDSIALMRLCGAVAGADRLPAPHAATVDHGLRAASADEARRVAAWADEAGIAHATLAWDGDKPKAALQARARAARYRLLAAQARAVGASALLTAHTLDDQAETVLMRLAHGSGLAGLAGMRPSSRSEGIAHLRPLLGISKARLVATCIVNGWPFVEDPSNADPRFERARWRAAMPGLARAGLTPQRLGRLARRLASADEALEAKAAQAYAASATEGGGGLSLDFAGLLRSEPREVALRVLLLALTRIANGQTAPLRLDRAEAALDAIAAAHEAGHAAKRSLAGAVLAYDKGRLALRREGPRRRGRHPGQPRKRALQAEEGNSNASLPLA
jgi:tRNA(Ile)-lysidine synthase